MQGEVVHGWHDHHGGGSTCSTMARSCAAGARTRSPFRGGGIGGRIQRLARDGSVLWEIRAREREPDAPPRPRAAAERQRAGDRVGAPLRARTRRRGRDPARSARRGCGRTRCSRCGRRARGRRDRLGVARLGPPGPGRRPAAARLRRDRRAPGRIDINADHRDEPPTDRGGAPGSGELEEQMRALGYARRRGRGGRGDGRGRPPPSSAASPRAATGCTRTRSTTTRARPDRAQHAADCELWVIDHSTTTAEAAGSSGGRYGHGGELLWRWGNPHNYGAGGEADRRLFYQHDAHWIPGGRPARAARARLQQRRESGPDGRSTRRSRSSSLPFDPERGFAARDGAALRPAEPAWSYADRAATSSRPSSPAPAPAERQHADLRGRQGPRVRGHADGRIVWEYWNPLRRRGRPPEHAGRAPPQALFRATRIAADHPGVVELLELTGRPRARGGRR